MAGGTFHCSNCGIPTCHNGCKKGLRCAVCGTVRDAPKPSSKSAQKSKKEIKNKRLSAKEQRHKK